MDVDVKYPRYALQTMHTEHVNVLMYVNEEDDGHAGEGYQIIASCDSKMDAEDVMAAMEHRFPHGTLNRREVSKERSQETVKAVLNEVCVCGHVRGVHHVLDENCCNAECDCDEFREDDTASNS